MQNGKLLTLKSLTSILSERRRAFSLPILVIANDKLERIVYELKMAKKANATNTKRCWIPRAVCVTIVNK